MPFGFKVWNSGQQNTTEALQLEVAQLKLKLAHRDEKIVRLVRENDKLRSVLCLTPSLLNNSVPQHATTKEAEDARFSVSLNPESCSNESDAVSGSDLAAKASSSSRDELAELVNIDAHPTHQRQLQQQMQHQKRQGVSAEPSHKPALDRSTLKHYEKDSASREIIRRALRQNEFLKNLNTIQLQEIVSCMREKVVPANSYIIREGEDGSELFVGAKGEYEVWKDGSHLCNLSAGRCFGELALLYNCQRTASVKALQESKVWALDGEIFRAIMKQTSLDSLRERKAFLRSVPLLKNISETQIMRIADVLETQHHKAGDCIIRKDEMADSFFIIESGEVMVSMPKDGQQVEIRRLKQGEYFGEKALLAEGRRTANVYAVSSEVKLFCLYRKDFIELIGNIQELKEKEYNDEQQLVRQKSTQLLQDESSVLTFERLQSNEAKSAQSTLQQAQLTSAPTSPTLPVDKAHHASFNPDDYTTIAVLGSGGFGRVELVVVKNGPNISYAMKRMIKTHIVSTKQQDHIINEKQILFSVDCKFICRLYATAKDSRFVYMLMEVCLGGELWTRLRDCGHMNDKEVRFSLACVIEAFDYLHGHGIIYRDLKPENLVVACQGYLKLCDFGFAKFIGIGNKTFTFCGTPEYVAPEVILNKGHDFAADYWSLGILTCELLTGKPPFQASVPIRIYMQTLAGIDSLDLGRNKHVSPKAYHFIKKLCKPNPGERMGAGGNGLQSIRNHKYFQGFDWEGVRRHTFQSPFSYKVSSPRDVSNFDEFRLTNLKASEENSGWDADF